MNTIKALAGGLVGSIALTTVHETMRRLQKDAPRMDLLGMQTLKKGLKKTDMEVPDRDTLFNWTMLGDIVGNALFYSLAGIGKKNALTKGTALGLAAGIGGVILPKYLGLDNEYSARTNKTKAMTIGWYLIGGVAAAVALKLLDKK